MLKLIQQPLQKAAALGLLSGLVIASGPAFSQSITGEQDLVCASQDVLVCTDGVVCTQGNARSFDLPSFMFVKFKSRSIRAVDEDGSELTSPIKTHEVTDKTLIMQGYENHRGWTVAVDRRDGTFNLSSTGHDVNFMIMGACTQL